MVTRERKEAKGNFLNAVMNSLTFFQFFFFLGHMYLQIFGIAYEILSLFLKPSMKDYLGFDTETDHFYVRNG